MNEPTSKLESNQQRLDITWSNKIDQDDINEPIVEKRPQKLKLTKVIKKEEFQDDLFANIEAKGAEDNVAPTASDFHPPVDITADTEKVKLQPTPTEPRLKAMLEEVEGKIEPTPAPAQNETQQVIIKREPSLVEEEPGQPKKLHLSKPLKLKKKVETSAVAEPTIDEVVAEDMVAAKPTIDEVVAEDTVAAEPTIDEVVVEDTVAAEPTIDEVVVEDTVAVEPTIDEEVEPDSLVEAPVAVAVTSQPTLSKDGFGAVLKYAREKRGDTIAKTAEGTRISKEYIQALEEEDFERLPIAKIYVKSYLKSLSRRFDFDAEALISQYEKQSSQDSGKSDDLNKKAAMRAISEDVEVAVPVPDKSNNQFRFILSFAACAMLILGMVLGLQKFMSRSQDGIASESLTPLNDFDLEDFQVPAFMPFKEMNIPGQSEQALKNF